MPLSRTIRVARTREKSTPADCGIFPRPHHSSGKPIALQRHHRRGPARLPTSPRPRATARSSIARPPHGGGEGGEGSGGDGGGGGGGDGRGSDGCGGEGCGGEGGCAGGGDEGCGGEG